MKTELKNETSADGKPPVVRQFCHHRTVYNPKTGKRRCIECGKEFEIT